MKAAVLHAIGDLRVEEVPKPEKLGADDVLIQVKYNGLCGTDATEFAKSSIMVPLEKPHPNSKHQGATILGHEFIGTVVEAGSNAKKMIGKRIACGAGVSCGSCAMCKAGRTNLCSSYYTLGLSTHGGLAEYVKAPQSICVLIPDTVSDESAALAQPLAVGIHGARRANIRSGDRVIVLGSGAIGSFVLVALKKYGVHITAIDVSESRLATAKLLGANSTLLIKPEDSAADLKKYFSDGADVVIESSGAPGSAVKALALVKMGGNLLLMGLNKTPQDFPFVDAVLREIEIHTTVAHVCKDDIPEALELLESGEVANLLTDKTFKLEDSVAAFEYLISGKSTGKILVTP